MFADKLKKILKASLVISITLFLFSAVGIQKVSAATYSCVSVAGATDWNSAASWSNCGSTYPGDISLSGNTVNVTFQTGAANAFTLSGNLTYSISSITFPTAGAFAKTIDLNGYDMTVTGNTNISRPATGGTNTLTIGDATFTTGSLTIRGVTGGTRLSTVNIAAGTLTSSGNITSAGVDSRIICSAACTINTAGTFMSSVLGTFTASTGKVNFTGASANLASLAYTFYNLQYSGTGTSTASAATIIQKDLTNTGGGTLSFGTQAVTFSGTNTQSIAGYTTTGLTSMTKTGGVATLTGNVSGGGLTINGSGGTLNLGTGLSHTFTGTWTRSNGTLDGGSSIINFTSQNVSGTGGTFTASTGTVKWSGAGQTAAVVTYNNLTIAGSGVKTFSTTPTVNGVLSLEGTATITVTSGVVTYGASATLKYNTTTSRTASSEEWITPFVGTGGVNISSTGAITPPGAVQIGNNTSVPFDIDSGATFTPNSNLLTVHGDFINDGTFTSGSGGVTIGGVSTQAIAGFTTTGTVSMTKTGGTATFGGNVNGGAFTINGSGGTLNLGAGFTHTFTGNWTRTVGTVTGNTSTLKIGGTVTNTGGTYTASAGNTVEYNGGAQTIASVTYYNLIFSGAGTKGTTGVTTVNNNFTASAGTATMMLTSIGGNFLVSGADITLGANLAVVGSTTLNTGTLTMSNFTFSTGSLVVTSGTISTSPMSVAFTVTGSTNINGGELTLDNNTGAKKLQGVVSVNSGGRLNGSSTAIQIEAGIGQSTAATVDITGTTTFQTNANQTIIGTLSFNNLVVGAGVTLTNSATTTVTGTVTLTGNLTQGAASTLTLSGATPFSGAGALDANTNDNLVHYNGAAQTAKATGYSSLALSGSGSKTLTGIVSVKGDFTMSGSATATSFFAGANNATISGTAIWTTGADTEIGALSVGAGAKLTMGNFAFSASSTTSVSGTVDTTGGSTGERGFYNLVTINSGGVWDLSGQNPATLFRNGITMNGTTFNNGTGAAAFGSSQAFSGSSNMTFGGTITPAVSVTITNNNAATVTISSTGSLVLTGNWTQGVNSTLSLGAAAPFSGAGTFDASTNVNTVIYSGAAQSVRSTTYKNLTINGTGVSTLAGDITVTNTLTITAGTLDTDVSNNRAITAESITVANSASAILTARGSTITLTGTGTVFSMGASGIINAGTSTIKLTNTSATGKTFAGGGKTYNNFWFAPSTGTGSLTISGDNTFADFKDDGTGAHTIIFTSASTTTITSLTLDTNSAQLITLESSSPGNYWNLIDTTGTNTVSYVSITDSCASGGASWVAYDGTNVNGGHTCGWAFAVPISISGTANGNNAATVKVAINGSIQAQTTTIASSAWTISGVAAPSANDIITVWVDGVSDANESTAVTKWSTGNITGMVLNTNIFSIGSNQNTSISLTNLSLCDVDTGCSDEDIMHSSNSNVLLIQASGNSYTDETLSVLASNTLTVDTTESVTSEKLNIAGTLTSTGNATYTLNGTSGTLFTRTGTFTEGTSTVVMNPDAAVTLTSGTITFYNLNLTPTITNNRTYTFGSGALTVNGDFTIDATSSGVNTLTVNMGAAITVAASKTTIINGTTSGLSNLSTNTAYTLSAGKIDIQSGGTLNSGSSTITLTGTSGTLLTNGGTFTEGTSTVVMNPDAAVTLTSGTITFYNLNLTPAISAARTYTFGSGALTINGNFNIQPTASVSAALTVNMGADITVASDKTTTMTGSSLSKIARLDTRPASTDYNFSTGFIVINNGILDAGSSSSIITLTGTSGTLFTTGTAGTLTQGTSEIRVTSASGSPTLFFLDNPITPHRLTINSSATIVNAGASFAMSSSDAANRLYIQSGVFNDGGSQITGTANGTLVVDNGATLCISGTAAGTNATCNSGAVPTTASTFPTNYTNGNITLGTSSNVIYLADAAQTISATPTYGNLKLTPLFVSTARTYTAGGALTINGDFTIAPDESGASTPALTVNPAGTITVASGKTTTISRANSATATLDLRPASTDYNLSTGLLNIATGGTLDAGSAASTITLTGNSGTLFTNSGSFTAGTSTIKITDTSSSGKIFAGAGGTYYNFWYAPGSGTGTLTLTGNNTFNDFKDDGSVAHSILFTAGSTTTVTTFTVSGNSGQRITINSGDGSGGTSTATHTLSAASGIIDRDYLNIQHSVASGGASWYAGANSVNNNSVSTAGSGWIFTIVPKHITISSSATTCTGGPNYTATTSSCIVQIADIQTYMNAGTSVSFTSTGGDITVSNSFTKSSGGDVTMGMYADGNIIINAAISSSSGQIDMLLNADRDASNSGYVNIGAALTSLGGDITIGGGSSAISAGSGFAYGNAGQGAGVYINGVTVAAAGGNIIVNGRGYNTSSDANYGVYITGASGAFTATGSGTITINGIGGGATSNSANNYGVGLENGGTISTVNGDITVTGTGGGAGSGNSNVGVLVTNINSTIKTTGSGNLIITGIRGGGNTSTNYGNKITVANGLQTTSTGNISLIGDTLLLAETNDINSIGNLLIKPYTASTSIAAGAGAGTLSIATAFLGYITWGTSSTLTVGAINAGDISINTTSTFANKNVTFLTGGNISLATNALTHAGVTASTLNLFAYGNITTTSAITASGSALTVNLHSDYDANSSGSISLGAGVSSNGGTVTILGGGGTISTTSPFDNLTINVNSGNTITLGAALNITGTGGGAWYNGSWTYRKLLTIDKSVVASSDQTNFPLLISLATDSELSSHALSNGNDILFTDSNGTKLPHEIERYVSGTGELKAWVKIPTLSVSTNTVLYMYYGNAGASNQQDVANVWDSNFRSVYHMKDVTTSTVGDSTTLGNTGTKQSSNNPIEADAKIGKGQTFNGSNNIPSFSTGLSPVGSRTVSAWIKISDTTRRGILGTRPITLGNGFSFAVNRTTAGNLTYFHTGGSLIEKAAGISTGTWYYVTVKLDTGTAIAELFVNGASLGTQTSFSTETSSAFNGIFGAEKETDNSAWNGSLDEIRISSVARSSNWITTEYNNQNNPTAYQTLEAETTSGGVIQGALTVTSGTLDTNANGSYGITTDTLSIANSSNAIFNARAATIVLDGTGSVFTLGASAVMNPGTSTIKLTDTSATSKTFAGGGRTYYNFWFAPQSGTGTLTVSGNNTFNDFKDTGSIAHSILFTTGSTQHVTTFNVNGSAGQLITINSTDTGTHALVKDGGGVVDVNYLNIQHSVATPSYTWFAGVNSTDNNSVATAGSGWVFFRNSTYRGGGGGNVENSANPDPGVGGGGVDGGGIQASSGPRSPGTLVDDATTGVVAWTNPTNAGSSNNVYATVDLSGTQSHYLKATNFGFSIPTSATIRGILVEIERNGTNSGIYDATIKIVKANGAIGSVNKSATATWSGSDTYDSFGSASDLWGETWTPSDINNSNFGVAIAPAGAGATPTCFVPGTKVKTLNGFKNIEDIKIGDEVVSLNEITYKISTAKIVDTIKATGKHTIVNIETVSGEKVTATDNHVFLTNKGYLPVSKIKVNDTVYIYRNNKMVAEKVKTMNVSSKEIPVYDIALEKDHLFTANNFIVHNPGGGTGSVDNIRITVTYTTPSVEPSQDPGSGQGGGSQGGGGDVGYLNTKNYIYA